MIGGTTEKYFKPDWFAPRNFHGMWFADSDELNALFGYQRGDVQGYWHEIARAYPVITLGKFVPKKTFIFVFVQAVAAPSEFSADMDTQRRYGKNGSLLRRERKDCKNASRIE